MSDKSIRPTKKQKQILDYIDCFIKEHGYSPSYREIMKGLDYKGIATIALHVDSLVKRGHLMKRDNTARSLEVVGSFSLSDSGKTIDSEQEKWLINNIEQRLSAIDGKDAATSTDIKDVLVLIEALRIIFPSSKWQELSDRVLVFDEDNSPNKTSEIKASAKRSDK